MTKAQFLEALKAKLSFLPFEELEDQLEFYGEMIDDRMDDGLSEEEAILAAGSIDEIAFRLMNERDTEDESTDVDEPFITPKRSLKTWETVLLITGAPLWIPLLIAAVMVVFSLYVVFWSAIIALWSVFVSLVGCTVGGTVVGLSAMIGGNMTAGLASLGIGFFCAGASILIFFGCREATRGTIILTRKIFTSIKKKFSKKEAL